jgi:uncharacterized membrane protein
MDPLEMCRGCDGIFSSCTTKYLVSNFLVPLRSTLLSFIYFVLDLIAILLTLNST